MVKLGVAAIVIITAVLVGPALAQQNGWQRTAGPEGIAVTSLAVDQSNPQLLYAVSDRDGSLLKTTNGGLSWATLQVDPALPVGDVFLTAVAIDPQRPSNVLTATIGATITPGIYQSTDAGATFQRVFKSPTSGVRVFKIRFDPRNPGVVYACRQIDPKTRTSLLRSTDSGASWSPVPFAQATGNPIPAESWDICMSPADPNVLLVAGDTLEVLRSTDRGATWSQSNFGLDVPGNEVQMFSGIGDTIYTSDFHSLYRSTNAGASWLKRTEARNITALRIDPADLNHLFVGFSSFQRPETLLSSTDGGFSFHPEPSSVRIGGTVGSIELCSADPSLVFTATDVGIFRGTAGANWSLITGGLAYSTITSLDPIASPSPSIVGYYPGRGLQRTTDGGETWLPVTSDGRLLKGAFGVDRANASFIYSAGTDSFGNSLIFQSTDAGVSFVAHPSFFSSVKKLAVDPTNPLHLIAATTQGLFVSNDGGTTWESSIGAQQLISAASLQFDPSNGSVAYATYSGVARSQDGGKTWAPLAIPQGGYQALALVPGFPNCLFAVTDSFKLFRSTDSGTSFQQMGLTGPTQQVATALLVVPAGTGQISDFKVYAASSNGGVFYSGNGGRTFADISVGIPANIYALAVDPSDGSTVYAAVNGNGVLRRTPVPVQLSQVEIQGKKLLIHGSGFETGAVILIDDVAQKTANGENSPAALLIAKKGGKAIAPGTTVRIKVTNPSGDTSNVIVFTRP